MSLFELAIALMRALPAIERGLSTLGHWAAVLVSNLTDVHLWISLGWLLLGAALIFTGVMLWLKVPQRAAAVAPPAAAL
jgi:hypothetical protein